jgi:hypothetical protein
MFMYFSYGWMTLLTEVTRIRCVKDWFEVVTELIFMEANKGTTSGEGLSQELLSLS